MLSTSSTGDRPVFTSAARHAAQSATVPTQVAPFDAGTWQPARVVDEYSFRDRERTRSSQRPKVHYWNAAVEHVGFWYDAVSQQRQRLQRDAGTDEPFTYLLADAMFLTVAVHRLRKACGWAASRYAMGSRVRSKIDKATGRFDRAFPTLEPLRHATEHFVEWIEGKGHGQAAPEPGAYAFRSRFSQVIPRDGARRFEVRIDGAAIDVLAAAAASLEMAASVNQALNEDLDKNVGDPSWPLGPRGHPDRM